MAGGGLLAVTHTLCYYCNAWMQNGGEELQERTAQHPKMVRKRWRGAVKKTVKRTVRKVGKRRKDGEQNGEKGWEKMVNEWSQAKKHKDWLVSGVDVHTIVVQLKSNGYGDAPSPPGFFESRQVLISSAKEWAVNHGYAIIIARSKPRTVYLKCDRRGKYQNRKQLTKSSGRRQTVSRLVECPFCLVGVR